MYAVKVEPGRERIAVRRFTSGFLPSYKPADISRGKKLVIPGYVFTLSPERNAIRVPETEWTVIEAITDSHESVFDPETGKITDGPLKDLGVVKTDEQNSAVMIRPMLLGVSREYWLNVKMAGAAEGDPAEPGEKPEGDQAATGGSPDADRTEPEENKTGEKKTMATDKTQYTEEQIREILNMAEEKGVHAAAAAYGVPWQTVRGWKHKANPDKVQAKKDKKGKKVTKAKAPGGKSAVSVPADAKDALKIENAVLRAENAKLEAKIEKLKKAIAALMAE